MLDCNVLVGNWPFRKIRNNTIEAIEKMHCRFGIKGGFVSSTDAIFYNDPMEADLDLSKALAGKDNYRHVVTVNPALPGACANLSRAIRELNPAGVRVYPNYHDFKLLSKEMEAICEICSEHKLPLFLTVRMDDVRTEYMVHSKSVTGWDILAFCQRHTDFPIIICNIRGAELGWIDNALSVQNNVCVDIAGINLSAFGFEALYEKGFCKYMVYGSNAPIYAMRTGMLIVERALVPEDVKAEIMSCKKFIDMIDEKYRPNI